MIVSLMILLVSVFAGFLGAILGIGGGAILIPALTLGFGIHIRYAIGASLISVIGTSSGAAASYVRDRLTNIRLAIFLEIATTIGALLGVLIANYIASRFLYLIFGLVLFHSAYVMNLRKDSPGASQGGGNAAVDSGDSWANRLRLNGSYPDGPLNQEIHYQVSQVPLGFLYMLVAGCLSGLLGIGSGILKVMAMDRAMGLPIKVSSATSNFMIGVTAAASAGVYFLKGDVVPELAGLVAFGVVVGATLGARLMPTLPSKQIRRLFVVVIFLIGIEMIHKGLS